MLVADCALLACRDPHERFLDGKAVAILCPRFDDPALYREKLTVTLDSLASLKVIHMEVPCYAGPAGYPPKRVIARRALEASGRDLPLDTVMLGTDGQVLAKDQAK